MRSKIWNYKKGFVINDQFWVFGTVRQSKLFIPLSVLTKKIKIERTQHITTIHIPYNLLSIYNVLILNIYVVNGAVQTSHFNRQHTWRYIIEIVNYCVCVYEYFQQVISKQISQSYVQLLCWNCVKFSYFSWCWCHILVSNHC